jgi:hypothetical protein
LADSIATADVDDRSNRESCRICPPGFNETTTAIPPMNFPQAASAVMSSM